MAGLVCDTDVGEEAGGEIERERDNNKHTNFDFTIKHIIRRVLSCLYTSVVKRQSCELKVLVGGPSGKTSGCCQLCIFSWGTPYGV